MTASPAEIGVAGVEVGHWTDAEARTGCTVVVLPPGTVASGEVRGGAPATREFALLAPERLVDCVDAVVLTGGSAFGLAACDGVMEVLEAEGRGFAAPHGPVPIVVGMALYDLGVGDPAVRPGVAAGRTAAANRSSTVPTGRVGAGAGATVSKWRGRDRAADSGLGAAAVRRDALTVAALVAANAAGDPDPGPLAEITAGTFTDWPNPPPSDAPRFGPAGGSPTGFGSVGLGRGNATGPAESFGPGGPDPNRFADPPDALANTSLAVVVTNAALDKTGCFWTAQGGHDGLARSFVPAHTRIDGDAVVAAATGEVEAPVDEVRLLATAAVAAACQNAVSAG